MRGCLLLSIRAAVKGCKQRGTALPDLPGLFFHDCRVTTVFRIPLPAAAVRGFRTSCWTLPIDAKQLSPSPQFHQFPKSSCLLGMTGLCFPGFPSASSAGSNTNITSCVQVGNASVVRGVNIAVETEAFAQTFVAKSRQALSKESVNLP